MKNKNNKTRNIGQERLTKNKEGKINKNKNGNEGIKKQVSKNGIDNYKKTERIERGQV